ncbi:PREDICTED: zinc phosphodiesterase ELAC protein 2 [Nanorana parkeri]|uniref:zinc phosphodiesterase ELAC protein 2 n=1 Tax=Nanorana parkeri TaxID=125878 RepID=UPI000854DF38|nr:PREDICTED: zinc phosphodiesterase ELAC protein 2 [Nanorana parkeri]
MGLSGLLWRRFCRPVIMSQAEVRAYSGRKNKAPKETLRHIKNKEKLSRTGCLGPHTFYVQAVAAGSRDSGASLYLFSEHNRYLFNCGEGTQRLMHENKLKLSHLNNVFVTRMNWANVGGLSGLLLTLRDVGLPSCVLSGPPQLEKFLQAIKSYCGPLEDIKVEVRPYTDPVYTDETMTVHQVPIFTNGTENKLPPQPLDASPSAEADDHKDGRTSTDPRWRRVNRGPPCVISYVCKIHDRKGHFLVAKAKEIGLPVGTREIGPLISQLKAGKSVIYQEKEISPADVLSPDAPGPTFLVVECPTEDFITPMTENETLKRLHEGNPDGGVTLMVHMTPEHILNHSSYRHWMERFGPGTEHLILNESVSSIHNQSAYRIQTQLNLIHPRIFPQLPELSRKEAENGVCGVKAECLLKYQLRPTTEWQRDMVTSNKTSEFVKEALELPGFKEALEECRLLLESDLSPAAGVDPQYPQVVFLGTGSAIPMKTRNVSSTLVHVSSSQVLLLDCGEGTFGQLYRHYGDEVDDILCQLSAVFVSHIHADHHTGLLRVLYERERALSSRGKPFSPVILVGPTILMTWLNQFHDHCQKILHNICFISSRSLMEDMEVDCPKTKNLISSLLEKYQLDKFQTCYVRHCKNAFGCAMVHQAGWKLVFSGDTMPCDALIKMGKDATLLIHEATLEDGLEQDAIEKAHSTTSQAIGVGKQMNAEYVMLNHFSQRYSKLPLMSDPEFSSKVGISFDHMRIRWSDFKILPRLMEPIKALFAEYLVEMEERKEKRERSQQEAENSAADSVRSASGKRDLEEDGKAAAASVKKMKAY